jgi:hypothetical protein
VELVPPMTEPAVTDPDCMLVAVELAALAAAGGMGAGPPGRAASIPNGLHAMQLKQPNTTPDLISVMTISTGNGHITQVLAQSDTINPLENGMSRTLPIPYLRLPVTATAYSRRAATSSGSMAR